MQDHDLCQTVRRQAGTRPDAIAYHTPSRTWTFAQMHEESSRVAQGLLKTGIKPGDRIAALTKHTADCLALLLGACKIGAVCMPVNWRLAAPEIEFILENGEAKMLLTDDAFLAIARSTEYANKIPILSTDGSAGVQRFDDWRAQFAATDPGYQPQPSQTAVQLYSSGTTGLPKGVELTHANLIICFSTLADEMQFGPSSIMLNTLPTFHISGVGPGLMTFYHGALMVFHPDFDPPKILRAIAEHTITHVFFVPAMILALLNTDGVDRTDYSSLKIISYGASPITDKVLIDALHTFKCGFLQVYGLTETTGAITYLPPQDHDPEGPKKALLRAAGRAGAGVDLRIVDAETGNTCADGDVGEVWIRTAQNMLGYWRNSPATTQAFPQGRERNNDQGGWFRSGDAGYLRDGYLFIHDRIKDMIISGGENIYPAEVENMLVQHPAIADCAVIGVPDQRWGEAVKACVVLRANRQANEHEVIAFSRERIAHYKCPKSVDFVAMLPRNPSGKILKYQLRAPYWKGHTRLVN